MLRFLHLGASLYVPATRPDLAPIANALKYPELRSMVFCTEDAIRQNELPLALANLETLLSRLEPTPALRFVRVRTPAVLRQVLQMTGVERLTGFVLPKVTQHNVQAYFSAFATKDPFLVMPTLETLEAFDPGEMVALRQILLRPTYRGRVLSLRIGGNDLFQLLGMRRPRGRCVYQTALRTVIDQLVTVFRPHGFNLTGPVFEYLDAPTVLADEVQNDLAHGLFGKTAIHPVQVPLIEAHYRVNDTDLQMAERILAAAAPPVFRCHDSMCEVATHRLWAEMIRERAALYGVNNSEGGAVECPLPDLTVPHQAFKHENGAHPAAL